MPQKQFLLEISRSTIVHFCLWNYGARVGEI